MAPTVPPQSDGSSSYLKENMLWLGLWFVAAIGFIVFPLCTSKRRRQACAQGCRERRWINADDSDDEDGPTVGSRRQQREETRRHFQINRTQEDGIRQQYLSFLMQDYTIALRNCDIIRNDKDTAESSSEELDESTNSMDEQSVEVKNDIESQCDATMKSSSAESGETPPAVESKRITDMEVSANTPVRRNRSDSEDTENLLECEFGKDQTVCVPLAGQAVTKKTDETGEATHDAGMNASAKLVNRRVVSNGCAICLCPFEANEEITWSSNPDCCHVFHNDCVVNWYLAYGRKTQKRRLRNNPNMCEEEALNRICDFPILCPCCRQKFCMDATCSSPGERDEEIGGAVVDADADANTTSN